MNESGLLNQMITKMIAKQGHQDLLMVVDAGFAIPSGVEAVDISLKEDVPMVLDVLAELKKHHSVEKMIIAKQTKDNNPSYFKKIIKTWRDGMEVELVEHSELKEISKKVKAIIRTGDFTAYGNVILVSGAGERWRFEVNNSEKNVSLK